MESSEVVKISAALYAKTSGFVVIYVHAAEKERRLIISIRKQPSALHSA